MTVDEFKVLADKITARVATLEDKRAFLAELEGALRECQSSLVH